MTAEKKHILNLAEICARKGVTTFVLSPGSRNAPLTLALTRHPEIKCYTVTDERAAAFIALGMAQYSGETVGLVCTSGSAVLNYYPAVAEAFYQKIPLLVLTADRPPEWIDQFDNQTIRQNDIYQKHCLGSFTLPVEPQNIDEFWQVERIASEAINLTNFPSRGPVQINIPLREPLYPENLDFSYEKGIRTFSVFPTQRIISEELWIELVDKWEKFERILIVGGIGRSNKKLVQALAEISTKGQAVVVTEITTNLRHPDFIYHPDLITGSSSEELKTKLSPDLLITFGENVICKSLKQLLRKVKPKEHWHLQEGGMSGDTYQALTQLIPVQPEYFFSKFASFLKASRENNYLNLWKQQEERGQTKLRDFFTAHPFSEFQAVERLLASIPEESILHLGNSMPVRYANILSLRKNVEVFANRGTSGIDGCLSTTIGSALASGKMTTIILGDLSFFYDRNGLWHNYLPENLRIVVLNNQGGGIFRILDGSGKQPELEDFFETKNRLQAENTAKDFALAYFGIESLKELETVLFDFFSPGKKAKLLEIKTESKINAEVFRVFREEINK